MFRFTRQIVNKKNIDFFVKRYKTQKTYLPNNEWLLENNDIYKIGIDKYASDQLGELVYIDFNISEGDQVNEDEDIVYLESVKAVGTVKAPFNCTIEEINEELESNLENINENSECEENSWLLKLKKL